MTLHNSDTMTMNIKQFKQHFLASELFSVIKNDPNVEPIMIYITGSTLTGHTDEQSDYDLCVLIRNKPSNWSTYVRPLAYFAVYTPENRKCQWVYNDIADIQKVSIFPQDNIGWAQFKYLNDTLILYKNPNYIEFIDTLLAQREVISMNSIFLFLRSCCVGLQISCPKEVTDQHLITIPKLAYHFVWAAGELVDYGGKPATADFLTKLKRNGYSCLSEAEKQYVYSTLQILQEFFIKYKQIPVLNFEEVI